MSDIAIKVDTVSKMYRIFDKPKKSKFTIATFREYINMTIKGAGFIYHV